MALEQRHSGERNFSFFSGLVVQKVAVATVTTAAAVSYTAAQIWGGEIHRDPNGSNRTDVLPTAGALVLAKRGVEVGSFIEVLLRNDADAAETITLSAGTGGTTSGTLTVAQNTSQRLRIRFTNVIYPNEAYEVSGLTGGTTIIQGDGAMASTTGTISSVNASASSVTLIAANALRLGLVISNDSTAILYVAFAAVASSSSYTYKIEPSDVLEPPSPGYTGIVTGIWASATGAARITELT